MNVHIGCSSFLERSWKGVFYPDGLPQSKWFGFYCEHFDTYEMNGTFYKFPTPERLAKWREDAPDRFLFSVKAPRLITHFKKMTDCKREIGEFYQAADALRDKLGAVLFQFPGQFHFTEERLSLLVASVNGDYPNVFEFRHESWWREAVFTALSDAGISFCGVSYPNLNEDAIITADTLYYRFHGNRSLFKSAYTDQELTAFAHAIAGHHASSAFIYFNNTATTAGIENALRLKAILKTS